MEVLLTKGGGRYVRKNNRCLLFCHKFSPVAELKRNFSFFLIIFLITLDNTDTCFGFCEITLSTFPSSGLTQLHCSSHPPFWCVLGLLDVSLYTYPHNLVKPITSGYDLYNDGSHIFFSYPDFFQELEIYIFSFLLDSFTWLSLTGA